jgi:hypothetical protein
MIICSHSNIDIIQGVIGYGDAEGITDWRISNTSSGILNIFNSSTLNTILSIENSNVGIGIANPSATLDINGDANITGVYKKNNRDVINDTSNYVLSTSNIIIPRILTEVGNGSNYVSRLNTDVNTRVDNTSNYILATSNILVNRIVSSASGGSGGSSQWTNVSSGIYYNTSNVGIGTTNPISKLHIYDETINNIKLTIQNNNIITNDPTLTPIIDYTSSIVSEGNPSITYKILLFSYNLGNVIAYYKFNNSSSLGLDSNPSSTKYNLTPTIVGGTGGYNTTIAIEGGSFQATNDGDRLEGDFSLKSIYDSSTTGISVSCWFYKKLATYDNIYNTQLFKFYNPSISGQWVIVTLSHYNNIYKASLSVTYTSGETYCNGFGPILAFDTWYHLVFVFTKSGTIKVYLNGANLNLVTGSTDGTIRWYGSSTYPVPQCPNTTKLRIFDAVGSGAFSGNVDEFYVFNKELTQTEVSSLYNKTYSLPNNTWNINFPNSIPVIINNGASQNVLGNYTISVGSSSSVIPAGGQPITPYPSTAITTIAIKYVTGISSIELLRGSASDNNRDYKVGNYGGEFKVISSTSAVDTDYIRITSTGTIFNPTGSSVWSTTSDRRIKENIEKASYDKCYENINKLELYRFNYINGFNNINKDLRQLGYIAQEVKDIFPKAVVSQSYNNEDTNIPDLLTIDISQINYTLYGAVKKLIELCNDKKSRLIKLANILNAEVYSSNITIDNTLIQ